MKLNKIDWTNLLFLSLNPLITFIALGFYFHYYPAQPTTVIFAVLFAAATNLSITVGYHRCFAHKSFDTHPVVKFFLLFFGASAFQGSALKWSSDHRIHHRHEDTESDPYSITKGFWHAHIGWLLNKDYVGKPIHAPDLAKNQLIMNQHKYYLLWCIGAGFIFPALLASIWGDFLGGLLIAGGLRIFLTQQSTFFVNSICHYIGNKPYSNKITARDSWFVALLTHGEGYHNFHHRFQYDFRNGIKWYHWDPTKWVIQLLASFKLAWSLKKVSAIEILKAQMNVKLELLQKKQAQIDPLILQLKDRVLTAQNRMHELKLQLKMLKDEKKIALAEGLEGYHQQVEEIKGQLEQEIQNFKRSLEAWNHLVAI